MADNKVPSQQWSPETTEELQAEGIPSGNGNHVNRESASSGESRGSWDVRGGGTKEASTNTPGLEWKKEDLESMDDEAGGEERRSNVPKFAKGLFACHSRTLDLLPVFGKFLFCATLRTGVYSIIACEQIYFSLRTYTRVLHLAMPSFFPQLRPWVATYELLLCLLVLASDVSLLLGIFCNPLYMFIWIDVHVIEMVAYIYLIISLAATHSECVLECPLIFSSYVICFSYFTIIVNSFRMSWELPEPSDNSIDVRYI